MSTTADEVRRLTRGALAQMRTLLLELRGQDPEEVPIEQLLRNVVEATEARARIAVDLQLHGDGPPHGLHTAIYRAAGGEGTLVLLDWRADGEPVGVRSPA